MQGCGRGKGCVDDYCFVFKTVFRGLRERLWMGDADGKPEGAGGMRTLHCGEIGARFCDWYGSPEGLRWSEASGGCEGSN